MLQIKFKNLITKRKKALENPSGRLDTVSRKVSQKRCLKHKYEKREGGREEDHQRLCGHFQKLE